MQDRAARQAGAERCDPGRKPQAHLRGVALGERRRQGGAQLAAGLGEGRVGGGELLLEDVGRVLARRGERDAELADAAALAGEAPARQRIGDLVGEDHAAERLLGQRIEPHHALAQVRRQFGQQRALALREIRAHLEDRVAGGQRLGRGQLAQHDRRHAPGAGAELEDVAARAGKHLRALPRHATAEEVGHLGRGDEVAAGADLGAAGAVVTEPGRIQRQLHEALERQPAAGAGQLLADQRRDVPAVAQFRDAEWRQD